MHQTQGDAADQAGGEGNGGGHEQVPQVRGGVQVGDGQALVRPGVVAGEGRVQPPELPDPGGAVHTRGIAASLNIRPSLWSPHGLFPPSYLDIDKQHRFVFGRGLLEDALLLPHEAHQPVVSLGRDEESGVTCGAHLEECVLHQDVVTREDVTGAALATRGPAAVT